MKQISIVLTEDQAKRSEALKELTGFSEAGLLRQAITAGLPVVEKAHAMIHEASDDLAPADQAVS